MSREARSQASGTRQAGRERQAGMHVGREASKGRQEQQGGQCKACRQGKPGGQAEQNR
jgi:hypothetical protein